jgi:hypothetical protein
MIKTLLLPAITAAGIALVEIPPAKAQVRITFPVTSYCGGYGGSSEQFLIGLGGKQDLVFGDTSKSIRVEDPRGVFLKGFIDDNGTLRYRTVVTGDHLIQTKGEGMTFFKVCAIDSPDKPFYPAKGVMS